jgi:hypothetical protein
MEKYGWWSVKFEITLDGEEVRFSDLSETAQEHIAYQITQGDWSGELVESIEEV